LLLKNNFSH
jgi:hypothetical protein